VLELQTILVQRCEQVRQLLAASLVLWTARTVSHVAAL
jgi:hypothetical protein